MKIRQITKHIPNALSFSRILIAFALVFDAWNGETAHWFVIGFIIAASTDFLDGLAARRLNATTKLGSTLDANADAILYLSVLFCIWLVHRDVVEAFIVPVCIVGATQISSWVFSLIKFGRLTCYHSYIAKIWAGVLFSAIISLFAFDYAGIIFWFAIIFGIISNTEDIVITSLLRNWACDVFSVRHAFRLRRSFNNK